MGGKQGEPLDLKQFVHIVNHMRDELMVVDREYRVVYVNKACRRHYGKSPDQLIGTRIWFGVKANDPTKTLVPGVFAHKRPMEHAQRTYTGAKVYTSAVPIMDEQGEVAYVAMNVCDEQPVSGDLPSFSHTRSQVAESREPVYASAEMEAVVNLARQVAGIPSSCLILGETGTGKSFLAKYMHSIGNRSAHPFVTVNCAGIPQDLMESELYGHRKGAFTGAISDKKGLFETARGGTLFLDEISELPLSMQAKLLHTLQEKEFRRVGGTRIHKTDVKVVAATNRPISRLVESKGFRADLYFRLNVFEITLPPLRCRPDDIPPLCHYFHRCLTREYGIEKGISDNAMQVLSTYAWPGNVRELSHTLERLLVICPGETIRVRDLPSFLHQTPVCPDPDTGRDSSAATLDDAVEALERKLVLGAAGRNKTVRQIAGDLGVSTTRAFRLIKKYRG